MGVSLDTFPLLLRRMELGGWGMEEQRERESSVSHGGNKRRNIILVARRQCRSRHLSLSLSLWGHLLAKMIWKQKKIRNKKAPGR